MLARILIICALVIVPHAYAADSAIDKRPPLLRALDGNWIMTGSVRGKPVEYRMTAAPTLQNSFSELHMVDVQNPSKYEAQVFIGTNSKKTALYVHWLDIFGGEYSVPHGLGAVDGNVLQFTFPYESGSFKDTFSYHPETDEWDFVLESAKGDGTWSLFARYSVRRVP